MCPPVGMYGAGGVHGRQHAANLLQSVPVTEQQNNMCSYEQNNATIEPKESQFFTALFSGWGVPGGLARILAGAVLGALSALWALSQMDCTAGRIPAEDSGADCQSKAVLPGLPD